jgi:spore coat protein U-like protein
MQTETVIQVRRRTDMTSRAWSNVPIGLAAISCLLLAAGPAAAQAQNPTLLVQARIGEVCTVTSASLDFGDAIDTQANNDASGAIEIDCLSETDLSVQLDGGIHGQFGNRAMSDGNGSPQLLYLLYKDAARLQAWTVGDLMAATINGSGSVPVYGRVPSQPNGHGPGLYTDEVTITLVF